VPEKKGFYGWKLVAVLFLLDFINMGFPYYGGSIINGYMIHDIVMSRSTLGLGFTILNLFVGFAAIVVAMSSSASTPVSWASWRPSRGTISSLSAWSTESV
jgi:hypothetical protein